MAATVASNPTFGAEQAPTFGGLTGYRRDVTSKPTAVPGNLPANRGNANVPGRPISTPTIQASYNRHDRGTNNVVSYSRVVDAGDVDSYGRTSPGDVVFTNRGARGPGYGPSGHTRVVGIDWLNTQLGGRPMWEPDKPMNMPEDETDSKNVRRVKHGSNWRVGHNVLVRKVDDEDNFWANKFNLQWRLLHLLQEWRCDGVVLSDDLPGARAPSSAERESQLFNIAVQGVCLVNNGYCSVNDKAVESNTRIGNGGNGRAYNQPNDPYSSSCTIYPKQMFDRDVFCGSDVFVGLVATPRKLGDKMSEHTTDMRFKDSGVTCRAFFERTHGQNAFDDADSKFYTFHYALFTSRQLMEFADATKAKKYKGAKGVRKLHFNRKVHPLLYAYLSHFPDPDDPDFLNASNLEPDPFSGPSHLEFTGMVGAWRIGKCIDAAARRKPSFAHGPYDTIDQISVNVCVEFYTLEQLINISYEQTVSPEGEYGWPDNEAPSLGSAFCDVYTKPPSKAIVDMQWKHALEPGQTRYNALEYMQWPTHVEQAPGGYAKQGDKALFSQGNLRDGFIFKSGSEGKSYKRMALDMTSDDEGSDDEESDGEGSERAKIRSDGEGSERAKILIAREVAKDRWRLLYKRVAASSGPTAVWISKETDKYQQMIRAKRTKLELLKSDRVIYPVLVGLQHYMIVAVTAIDAIHGYENSGTEPDGAIDSAIDSAITYVHYVLTAIYNVINVVGDNNVINVVGDKGEATETWEDFYNSLDKLIKTLASNKNVASAVAVKEKLLSQWDDVHQRVEEEAGRYSVVMKHLHEDSDELQQTLQNLPPLGKDMFMQMSALLQGYLKEREDTLDEHKAVNEKREDAFKLYKLYKKLRIAGSSAAPVLTPPPAPAPASAVVDALPPRSANLPPASPAKPSDETTLSGTLRKAFPSLAPAQDAFASLFGTETVVSSAPPAKAPAKPPAKPPAAAAAAAAASSSSIGASASEQPPSDHDFLVVPSNRPAPPTAPVDSGAPKKRGVSPGKKAATRRRTD